MKRFVMLRLALLLAAAVVGRAEDAESADNAPVFTPPKAPSTAVFFDDFQSGLSKWSVMENEDYSGEFELLEAFENSDDKAFVVAQEARKYGAVAQFGAPLGTEGDIVIQYDITFAEGLQCGGAYIKVLREQKGWGGELEATTPYTVMFGPDKCGGTNKVHFIFQHQHPVTGEWVEHHLANPPAVPADRSSHLYAVAIRQDNSFSVYVDSVEERKGSLLDGGDFHPPLVPPEQINDPDDFKPDDWVDESRIPDPAAEKPEDWDEDAPFQIEDASAVKPDDWLDDEEELVADPEAVKPEDWDDEDDGEWEPNLVANPKCTNGKCGAWTRPKVKNPAYKGKWAAPMVDNPLYKGEWAPQRIANPDYFTLERAALAPMSAVAIEIWTMQKGITFDNFYIGTDSGEAYEFGQATWTYKKTMEAHNRPPEPGLLERATDFMLPIFEDLQSMKFTGSKSQWTLPFLVTMGIGIATLLAWACCACCDDDQNPRYEPNKAPEKKDEQAEAEAEAEPAAEEGNKTEAAAPAEEEAPKSAPKAAGAKESEEQKPVQSPKKKRKRKTKRAD